MLYAPPPGFNAGPINRQSNELLGAPPKAAADSQNIGGTGLNPFGNSSFSVPSSEIKDPTSIIQTPDALAKSSTDNLTSVLRALLGQK
jgi:hypothetical protein